jgi:hypothetical protein
LNSPNPWEHDTGSDSADASDALIEAVRRDLDPASVPLTPATGSARVICWPRLSLDDEQAQVRNLDDWLAWFVSRYSLDHRTIPPCWHRHGALIEELSAIRSLWQTCFGRDASPADPTTFHEHLSLALARLRDWTARRDCKPGHHREDQPPVWHGIKDSAEQSQLRS